MGTIRKTSAGIVNNMENKSSKVNKCSFENVLDFHCIKCANTNPSNEGIMHDLFCFNTDCICHSPTPDTIEEEKNQCDGCVKGMPFQGKGGYHAENGRVVMICQKNKYSPQQDTEEQSKCVCDKSIAFYYCPHDENEDTELLKRKIDIETGIKAGREQAKAEFIEKIEGMRKEEWNVKHDESAIRNGDTEDKGKMVYDIAKALHDKENQVLDDLLTSLTKE